MRLVIFILDLLRSQVECFDLHWLYLHLLGKVFLISSFLLSPPWMNKILKRSVSRGFISSKHCWFCYLCFLTKIPGKHSFPVAFSSSHPLQTRNPKEPQKNWRDGVIHEIQLVTFSWCLRFQKFSCIFHRFSIASFLTVLLFKGYLQSCFD